MYLGKKRSWITIVTPTHSSDRDFFIAEDEDQTPT
jgi:hypothetical protein